jgi:hypothetical protein
MTPQLKDTVVGHCAGNLRILVSMCAELLTNAALSERNQLDEQLYFDTFGKILSQSTTSSSRKRTAR